MVKRTDDAEDTESTISQEDFIHAKPEVGALGSGNPELSRF